MAKIKWEEDQEIEWSDNPYKWDEVLILIEAAGGAGDDFGQITKDYTEEKKKKLVKIVCQVNGIKYEDEKWKKSAGKVNATQIKIAVSKVLGIKIDI